jgi:hypothetical protein
MSDAANRPWRRGLAVAAIVLASGTTGWVLGQRGHGGREPASPEEDATHVATLAPASETRMPAATAESFDDGTAMVQVAAEDETTLVRKSSCEPADEGTGVLDVALLERTLTEGTETERYAALTEALQSEFDLPARLLQRTYVNDLSESVRVVAFKAYVDSISDDRREVRDTLESGVYDMSAAVQAESRRRLAELERYEHTLAAAPLQNP